MNDAEQTGAAAAQLLFSVLMPEMEEEAAKLRSSQTRLVHYTSAENALNIIRNGQFWLRNVRCMNDYSEVQHGIGLLIRTFGENDNARRERLIAVLDKIAPGAARAGIEDFDQWIPTLPDTTFIGCLSQWDPSDVNGRLSMWRAYTAAGAGIALVLNSEPFLSESDELNAYSVPVAYLSDAQFADGVDRCLASLEESVTLLAALDFEAVKFSVFWWLLMMAISLKHPAFAEELEWRILYLPSLWKSDSIIESIEVVRGLPQIVQKIPLRDDPENGLMKADMNSLLHKLVIGPSEYPLVLFDAFASALELQAVTEPKGRIGISFIPLRS